MPFVTKLSRNSAGMAQNQITPDPQFSPGDQIIFASGGSSKILFCAGNSESN
jgi:hypothetical protein